MQIAINDGERGGKREAVQGGAHTVISRSGLSATEHALIEALPTLRAREGVLVMGNRTGACAMLAAARWSSCPISVHGIDCYPMNRVQRNLDRHGCTRVQVACSAFLDPAPRYDLALIQSTENGLAGELLAEFLDAAQQALAVGGRLVLAADGAAPWLLKQLKRLFGKMTVKRVAKDAVLITATRDARVVEPKPHACELVMTMHQKQPVRLLTLPGVFAHRRVDEGAQALAEVAEARPGDRVLDIGCGSGVVGIALACNRDVARTVFVDANARAVHIATENCRRNGLTNYEVILSADGLDRPGAFTLAVGNPPYFSDYKIAELFVQTAYAALAPRGRAYMVAKTGDWHLARLQALFGNGERIRRRGYDVLRAVKEV